LNTLLLNESSSPNYKRMMFIRVSEYLSIPSFRPRNFLSKKVQDTFHPSSSLKMDPTYQFCQTYIQIQPKACWPYVLFWLKSLLLLCDQAYCVHRVNLCFPELSFSCLPNLPVWDHHVKLFHQSFLYWISFFIEYLTFFGQVLKD
jgi:hypothetical protein